MGDIAQILKTQTVRTPPFNNRFVVELCENVHLHYRNVRLEFSKEEFFQILRALENIDPDEVYDFPYGVGAHKELASLKLYEKTPWDERLQIERQREGHFHYHYRNLRLEVEQLHELGLDLLAREEAKIATLEQIKDVFSEGIDVGRQLGPKLTDCGCGLKADECWRAKGGKPCMCECHRPPSPPPPPPHPLRADHPGDMELGY